jgi:hypothetical protein
MKCLIPKEDLAALIRALDKLLHHTQNRDIKCRPVYSTAWLRKGGISAAIHSFADASQRANTQNCATSAAFHITVS